MTVEFFCPSGHRLSAPDDWGGRQFRCPICKQYSVVPEPHSKDPTSAGTAASGFQSPAEARPPEGDGLEPSAPDSLPAGSMGDAPWEQDPQSRSEPVSGSRAAKPPSFPSAQRPGERSSRGRPAARRLPGDAYQPDRGKVQTTRWLAFLLALAVLFSMGPVVALGKLDLQSAPGWARLVVLLAALEAVYVVWMVAAPDWSSVWVVMLVFAFAASGYGMATAVAIVTPPDRPMPLGMDEVRQTASTWCLAVLLVNSLATYLRGRTSTRWRRAFELEMAARQRLLAKTPSE